MKGIIFDIKEMAIHDGPGLRTTVFFKGCPLRCSWCHNPEGLSSKIQLKHKKNLCRGCGRCLIPCNHPDCKAFGKCIHICPENALVTTGQVVDSKELSKELIKNAEILGSNFGGFTFSGGEPLAQIDFLSELKGYLSPYHLAIETSGFAQKDSFIKAISGLDLVIMDIKIADPLLHKKYTGVSNELILENFAYLKKENIPHIIRTPLIKGITDTDENLSSIKDLVGDSPWEKLPENTLAKAKYDMLGIPYLLSE